MPHKRRVALAVALQILILAVIAALPQWTLARGTVVRLETAPLDPRDLFRGDYVTLTYKISTLHPKELGATEAFRQGQIVYVGLEPRGRYWEPVSLGSRRPDGVSLRGRIGYSFEKDSVTVLYGIETYFVPEGRGRTIEGTRQPLTVEVAVGRNGMGVIRRLYVGDTPVP